MAALKKRPKAAASATLSARIVAAHGQYFRAELADGRMVSCVTRGKKTGVACGDEVDIAMTATDQAVIEKIGPRKTLLYRSDLYREKIIAANVDQIVLVVAAVPSFYEGLLARALVAAESAGITVLIVLNKTDLPETAAARAQLALYENLGYSLLALSAKQSILDLRPRLQDQTSVLVGQSGVGKSTLINALLPDAKVREGEISAALDSGIHTTTRATMYHLDATSHIIDSPGLQEFGLHHLEVEDIANAFREFRPYLGECKFHNCRHLVEPDCAVEAAFKAGVIDPGRFNPCRDVAAAKLL